MSSQSEFPITPFDCITRLPEIPLDRSDEETDDSSRRAELRRSILPIAELNHVTETKCVRDVVVNALGKLPSLED